MLQLNCQQDGLNVGRLSFNQSLWRPRLKAKPTLVSITSNSYSDNDAITSYISDVYRDYYDATIAVQYPKLACLKDGNGQFLAAVGFRPAAVKPLFLEQYLGSPIEQILQIPRNHVVEIGNLASKDEGASIYLFAALATYLNHLGFDKAAVTCTGFLEKRFRYLGLNPQKIAMANPNLLLQDGENWGSYYQTNPYVLVGSIKQACQRLQKILKAEYQTHMPLTVIDSFQS
ncbi:MAG: hypothetical protein ACI82Z_000678 [Cellvibrionaceae bacterium]|jgi:hypothetical protein